MKLNLRQWFLPSQNHSLNDFEIVRNILLSTWFDTYSSIVPPDELKTYLNLTCNDDKLIEAFNDKNIKGIIAEADGKPVGWLRTNIDQKENKFFINQLYVLKEYQGKGIGKRLMEIAEEEALKNNFDKIWLGVMSENLPSVEWYKRLGFIFVEELPFTMVNTKVNHLFGWKKVTNNY
ncbi:MAG: GNAT family N-acetyltransferase [Ignavibacteriales bacterium]|nr:MAG: GNAT family N-acetyltransferase [Ignavibacteriales bacterium]